MPIIGTTDQASYDPTRSMQMVAKIKKGSPKIDGKWGNDLDHFRFDIQPQFMNYSEILVSLYGENPKRFDDVLFVAETPERAFDNWFEQYNTSQTLKVRCDGVTIHKYMPKGEFTHSYHHIPCINKPDTPCECKQIGRLSFILSDFSMRTGVYGYFMMETHSWHDLTSIFQALGGVHNQFGSIRNMKWVLERVEKTVNSPKQDKNGKVTGRVKIQRSLVNLRPSEESIQKYILPKLQEQEVLPDVIPTRETHNLLQSVNYVQDVAESPDSE